MIVDEDQLEHLEGVDEGCRERADRSHELFSTVRHVRPQHWAMPLADDIRAKLQARPG